MTPEAELVISEVGEGHQLKDRESLSQQIDLRLSFKGQTVKDKFILLEVFHNKQEVIGKDKGQIGRGTKILIESPDLQDLFVQHQEESPNKILLELLRYGQGATSKK